MFNLGAFLALLMLIVVWVTNLFVPPPANICGSNGGPPITGPRITLRDGRHLSYLELGVPKEEAKFKIVFIHGHSTNKKDSYLATSSVVQQQKIYIVSFDRPGYGESDPHPDRTIKSSTLDVEELADQLGLGEKFYVIAYSMGGMLAWGCVKYIPHRLAGITFISPGISFWWPGLPQDFVEGIFYEQREWTQWNFRIAHYFPYLMYWWNTQDTQSLLTQISQTTKLEKQKLDILRDSDADDEDLEEYSQQQGLYESTLMDIIVGFGESWEFEPMELENPFPNGEGTVNLWQGDKDRAVSVELQRFVVSKLPWVNYHEIPYGGHTFSYADNMKDKILQALVRGAAKITSSNSTNVPISTE
ncbi:hypothetical protein Leryth_024552 [Lithospermum erythrorhizon]|nr:hypothetical protein Leryth_024552 [Lithospermum erythrorhizon]